MSDKTTSIATHIIASILVAAFLVPVGMLYIIMMISLFHHFMEVL